MRRTVFDRDIYIRIKEFSCRYLDLGLSRRKIKYLIFFINLYANRHVVRLSILKRVYEINVKVEKQLKKSTPQFLFRTK